MQFIIKLENNLYTYIYKKKKEIKGNRSAVQR